MKTEKQHIIARQKNGQRLLYSLIGALLLLLVLEFFVHKHPYFAWEEWFGFYGVFGFAACVVLVLAAKYILRPLVKREEDYYD
jgi:hypothetical protein